MIDLGTIGISAGTVILGLIGYGELKQKTNKTAIDVAAATTKEVFDLFKDETFRRLDRIEGKLDRNLNGHS